MFRSLVAAGLFIAAALCSAEVEAQNMIYGLVDAGVSHGRPPGGDYQNQFDDGDMSRSYLGFRGSEDLGGGLRAVYKLESYLRLGNGEAGSYSSTGAAIFNRDSNVGFSGQFGTTVLGRTVTPFYLATVNFNAFGDSFAFSPSVRQYYRSALVDDRSWNNSISYINNAGEPLRVNVAANTTQESADPTHGGHNYGGSVAYITGPFAATLAFEYVKNTPLPVPAGFNRQNAIQVGASYDFKFMRLYGQLGRVEIAADYDTHTTLYQIGAAVPIDQALILVAYGSSQLHTPYSQTTDRITSIAYDYFVSKRTDIYLAASHEQVFMLSSGNTLAGGMRFRF
jgi:predicted porin